MIIIKFQGTFYVREIKVCLNGLIIQGDLNIKLVRYLNAKWSSIQMPMSTRQMDAVLFLSTGPVFEGSV